MSDLPVSDRWLLGSPYERYIGRWSRRVAPLFAQWLEVPPGARWVDVGCGTGALSAVLLDRCAPASLVGIEPSDGFRQLAVQHLGDRARFLAGHAAALPLDDGACDVVVSGLVLNFVPDLPAALAEMRRVAAPGGTIAAYVWDYAGRMAVIKAFWDAAAALDPAAAALHEGVRFPLCRPAALQQAFEAAGLTQVRTAALDLTASFVDFEDYWQPFLGGQGPAPSYVATLPEDRRAALRGALASSLAQAPGPGFSLGAGAWAVRGTCPGRP
ncbi:MAG: methyltransferase domain-containing protein [Piscinibacter sp.]|nr:methyltransferase domain-containing protein [Piscinibacter sp.]